MKYFYGLFIIFVFFSYSSISGVEQKPIDSLHYQSTFRQAQALQEAGQFDASAGRFKEALDLSRKINSKEGEIRCLMNLGLLCWNIGGLQDSTNFYRQALDLARSLGFEKEKQKCLIALEIFNLYSRAKDLRSAGRYYESIECFKAAMNSAEKIDSREHEVKCLRQMSANYWELNKIKEFYELSQRAQVMAHALNHRKEEGVCFNNIGLYYWKTNNYAHALKYYELALDMAEKENSIENKARCFTNISLIYIDLGEYDRALSYQLKVLEYDRNEQNDNYISIDLNNIGIIFRNKGITLDREEDFLQANRYFYDALFIANKIKNKKIEYTILNNIGEVFYSLKKYIEAFAIFKLALKKAGDIQDKEAVSKISNNIGNNFYELKNYQEAIKSYKLSIDLAQKADNEQTLWEAYFGLGRCYERQDDLFSAIDCYRKSIEIIDRIRSQIFLDTFKTGFVRNKLKVYESIINLLFQIKEKKLLKSAEKDIFNFVEKAKARAFLECLAESRIDIRENLSDELREEENRISGRISTIGLQLSAAHLVDNRKRELKEKLIREEDSYLRLISKMRAENPAIANLVSPEPCRLDQVQNDLLDAKTALIEYFLGEQKSLMFFVTKNSIELYSLPPKQELENSLKAYLKYLSTAPLANFEGAKAANRIYTEILFPLADKKYDGIKKLVIVPDGILYYLPFEALALERKDRDFIFLISKYQVSYAPSSSVLFFLSDMATPRKYSQGLLALGDPCYRIESASSEPGKQKSFKNILSEMYLNQGFNFSEIPYARDEIEAISEYFPKHRKTIFLGKGAQEEVFKKMPFGDYQIIHFACHGFLDVKQPLRSALVLSLDGNKEEDGFLQVRELYNLRLKANLVILSACQTGKGLLENTEGILGLPRIFFYSGAKSVVSTLWSINDKSTAFFMRKYYLYLSKKCSKALALRYAKIDMIRSNYAHPFYWAGFVLNGEFDSTIEF